MSEEKIKYTKEEIEKFKEINFHFNTISEKIKETLTKKSNGNIISYISNIPSKEQTVKEFIFDEIIVHIFKNQIKIEEPIIVQSVIVDKENEDVELEYFFVAVDTQLPICYLKNTELKVQDFPILMSTVLAHLKTQAAFIEATSIIELPKPFIIKKSIEEVRRLVNSYKLEE